MHESSLKLMAAMQETHLPRPRLRVLDVGGADINGSYRVLFKDHEYVTLDHENADIIVKGYVWPLEDESFDVVISGQCFEHDKFFWLTLKNIAAVLRPGGPFFLIVPAEWPIHRYPIDCYRFLPDSLAAMAEWAELELIETRFELPDLGGVFRKPAK